MNNRLRALMSRLYREEAGDGGGDGGNGGGGAVTDLASILPPEYKDSPALKDYKDIGGLVKSHLNLQSMVGNSIKVPTDDNPDSWAQVYNKLGRPEKPDGYEFDLGEDLKDAQLNPELTGWAKELFHKHGLTKAQANGMMKEYVQRELAERGNQKSRDEIMDEYEDTLRDALGESYDESIELATRARDMFLDADTKTFLNSTGLGSHPGLVQAFVKIGNLLKEDKAFADGAASAGFAAGPEAAKQEIAKLNMDKEFMDAYMNKDNPGHAAAVTKRQNLYKTAYPGKVTN